MANKIKALEKNFEIASQISQKMESLWIKVEDLDSIHMEKHGENCLKWPFGNQSL